MAANAIGRPSTFSEETASRICELISQGLSRRKACEIVKVPLSTVTGWITDHSSFSAQYARAEENRADHYFEHILNRAQNIVDAQDAQVARVEIDAIKWACAKLLPRKYADKPADNNVNVNVGLQLIHSIPRPERKDNAELQCDPAVKSGARILDSAGE